MFEKALWVTEAVVVNILAGDPAVGKLLKEPGKEKFVLLALPTAIPGMRPGSVSTS